VPILLGLGGEGEDQEGGEGGGGGQRQSFLGHGISFLGG
jgi:hypothetical protein